jgi:hypothetical protein
MRVRHPYVFVAGKSNEKSVTAETYFSVKHGAIIEIWKTYEYENF